ncbi:MAG: MerR family transcriptional regulator [Acidocella sp.]|nr:MerR family transcriptional regulator [Acidocella sp.]
MSDDARNRPRKSAEAYRTISEVADDLHVPQHVLRFWETKFPRIKPLKRGGGRRYYRPDDVVLLRRIAGLLYIQGYTIKGVQRLLKEGGGALHDEIPPASDEERAAAAAERAQTSVHTTLATSRADLPELPMQHVSPQTVAVPTEQSFAPDIEVLLLRSNNLNGMLRSALHATLDALEQLRARMNASKPIE